MREYEVYVYHHPDDGLWLGYTRWQGKNYVARYSVAATSRREAIREAIIFAKDKTRKNEK